VKVLEALSHGLANKLMHGPTRYLNQHADAEVAIREMFKLPGGHF
jgi:glutamyl-tRNA reductase